MRETLDFSGRCLGVGTRYELLAELSRREKEAGIKPDSEIDAFMKAISVAGQETSLVTDYALKVQSPFSSSCVLFLVYETKYVTFIYVDRFLAWTYVLIFLSVI